jgi:hypothetical protein
MIYFKKIQLYFHFSDNERQEHRTVFLVSYKFAFAEDCTWYFLYKVQCILSASCLKAICILLTSLFLNKNRQKKRKIAMLEQVAVKEQVGVQEQVAVKAVEE